MLLRIAQLCEVAKSAHFPTSLCLGGWVALLSFRSNFTSAGLLGGLVTTLITLSVFLLNDINDITSDSFSKPYRPLVSGSLNRETSLFWVAIVICISIPLLISTFILEVHALLLVSYFILCLFYPSIKNIFAICKDFYVGFSVMLPPLFGVIESGSFNSGNLFLLLSFSFYIAHRELLMDVHDTLGDAAAKIRTIPVVFGASIADHCSWVLWVASVCFVCIPSHHSFILYANAWLFIITSGSQFLLYKRMINSRWRLFTVSQWGSLMTLGTLITFNGG